MSWFIMAWKKFAVFSGRSRRKEYWFFILFNMLVMVALGIVAGIMTPAGEGGVPGEPPGIIVALIGIYALAAFVPAISVAVRRLHDTNRSGWWILIGLVPVVGFIVLLVFYLSDSQEGDNRFGPTRRRWQSEKARSAERVQAAGLTAAWAFEVHAESSASAVSDSGLMWRTSLPLTR